MLGKLKNLFNKEPEITTTIVDDTEKLEELSGLIDGYDEKRKLLLKDCSEINLETHLTEIIEYTNNIVNKLNFIESLPDKPNKKEFSADFRYNTHLLHNKILEIMSKTKHLKFSLNQCKEKEIIKEITKENNYTHFDSMKNDLNENTNYYKYDLKSKTLKNLGKFIGKYDTNSNAPREEGNDFIYYFTNFPNGEIRDTKLIFIQNKSTPPSNQDESAGGKPKKTRRRKNKKRRSSKQQKSKK